jgi:hypothetical protein
MTTEKVVKLLDTAYEFLLAVIRFVAIVLTLLLAALKKIIDEATKLLDEARGWVVETVENAFGIFVWMVPFLALFEVAQRINWNATRALYVLMASSFLVLGLGNMNRGGMVLSSLYVYLVSILMDIPIASTALFF